MTERMAPSVARLWELVERVAPRDEGAWGERPPLRRGRRVSGARARQLRATVRQLEAAATHPGMPEGAERDVAVLLSTEGVDAFLDLAADGLFRDPEKGAVAGRPLALQSLATLRDCVKILAEEAGVEGLVLPRMFRPQAGDLARTPTPAQAAALYRRLADVAAGAPLDAIAARTLAAVGVILDTGMQSGDMVTRRLEHVDLEGGRVRALYRPQNAVFPEGVEETLALRPGTVVALRRWLVHRGELVATLEGRDPLALWVTVTPVGTRTPGGVYAAGMPLGARGFAQAHARGIDRLNDALAGRWDQVGRGPWVPLPRRPEQLRRAVQVEPLGAFTPLSDGQWAVVAPLLPPVTGHQGGRPWMEHRSVLDAIGWRYQTRGLWSRLPAELGPAGSVVVRLHRWLLDGTWDRIAAALLAEAGGDVDRVAWVADARASAAAVEPAAEAAAVAP